MAALMPAAGSMTGKRMSRFAGEFLDQERSGGRQKSIRETPAVKKSLDIGWSTN
jgi:hypothetical protein